MNQIIPELYKNARNRGLSGRVGIEGQLYDREVLQSDLSRLEDWSRKWQLRFNAGKCKVLQIGRDNEHYYTDRNIKILSGTAEAGTRDKRS